MPYEERSKSSPAPVKKPHNITMESRKKLSISGVEDVENFDEHEIVMLTSEGNLIIRGEDLTVSRLNVESGDLNVQGLVTELRYEEVAPSGSLWSKLFR